MHPGYSANIDLTCLEDELDYNPAFKAMVNAIEDAVQTYLASGPKSVQEINIAVGPHNIITQLYRKEPCHSSTLASSATPPTAQLMRALSSPSLLMGQSEASASSRLTTAASA